MALSKRDVEGPASIEHDSESKTSLTQFKALKDAYHESSMARSREQPEGESGIGANSNKKLVTGPTTMEPSKHNSRQASKDEIDQIRPTVPFVPT